MAGQGRHLFIRTTPARLEELRAAIDRLDRPPQQLLISVHQGRLTDAMRRQLAVTGTSREPGVRARHSRTRSDLDSTHRIRTLEGRPAFIATGKAVPVPYRSESPGPGGWRHTRGTVYRDAASGFYVLPRVHGDTVTLEISPFMKRAGDRPHSFETQRAATTVSGRLGEWIPVGGVDLDGTEQGRGILRRHTTLDRDGGEILLRVDRLP